MKPLVVFVPDSTGSDASVKPLAEFVLSSDAFKGSLDLVCSFELPLLGNRQMDEIAIEIESSIDAFYSEHQGSISNIVLCGYSLGAMLIRRAFLDASGFGMPAGQIRRWVHAVDRIVLVGAICRGFHFGRLPFTQRLGLRLASLFGCAKTIRSAFVGEPWASNVRLDWINYWQAATRRPRVVNVLGSHDPLVTRADAIDVEKDPSAAFISVPGATHDSIVQPDPSNGALLLEAFTGNPPHVEPQHVFRAAPRVYMLLHGMRSSKHFMATLAQKLAAADRDAEIFNPDYGYIPLFSFLSRGYRHKSATRFIDDYIQRYAANPGARFFFAGHSNGTCIMGEAIQSAPRLRFERIYLGGSALPRSFDWRSVFARHQVIVVRSDHGSVDWAVGILARSLERLSHRLPIFKGVGSGGYDGFDWGLLSNEQWFHGGHSSMFEQGLDSIVAFLTDASDHGMSAAGKPVPPRWFSLLHRNGDILLMGVLAISFVAVVTLFWSFARPLPWLSTPIAVSSCALMMALAAWLAWRL